MYEILRKLDAKEMFILGRANSNNLVITFKLRSKVNLFDHIDRVKNGIHAWMDMHSLLRSKISQIENELYFVLNDEAELLENVHFIRVKSSCHAKNLDSLIFDLIIEKCLVDKIGIETGLLWRLLFIETSEFLVYEVMLQKSHVIANSISTKASNNLLLEFIQQSIHDYSGPIHAPNLDMYSEFCSIIASKLHFDLVSMDKTNNEKTKLIKSENAQAAAGYHVSDQFVDLDLDKIDIELYDVCSNKIFTTLAELLECSRKENNIKPKRFVIDQAVSQKIFARFILNS